MSLWANIAAKRARIKKGSGERMRKKGEKGAPSPEAMARAKSASEALGPDADAGDYVKDFRKSKAPQFKGKSDKKKQKMAIAAYLTKKRGPLDDDIDEKTYMRRDRKKKNLKVPVKRKSGRMIKDEMTTTASIPNPADTAMGPNTIHDKRRKKDKKPVLLKRFRKYIEDNGIGEECVECQFDHVIMEAEYQGKQVKLNDPIRTSENPNKKFKVYTKGPTGNIVVVRFGDPNMSIKRDDPNRRKSFRARHNCDNPGPKHKARYWSCYQWRAGAKVDN
tara:strand:+ start:1061 stop:1888 length:828 start_codon:yes stop_codon:yes gene_type:complete